MTSYVERKNLVAPVRFRVHCALATEAERMSNKGFFGLSGGWKMQRAHAALILFKRNNGLTICGEQIDTRWVFNGPSERGVKTREIRASSKNTV